MSAPRPAPSTRMWLDGSDRITAVDEAWLAFAAANDASELTREAVLGVPLHEFVSGPEVAELTRRLLARARAVGRVAAIPFRCDHPGARRYMTMTLELERDDSLRFDYAVEREEPRPWSPVIDRRSRRSDELLRLCSWCNRAHLDGAWLELDHALGRAELFARSEPVPRLTHGLCEDCSAKLR